MNAHQLRSVGEPIRRLLEHLGPGGRISAQRDDVLDPAVHHPVKHLPHLRLARPHAGEVGHRAQTQLVLDARDQRDRAFARGAARAVGHRHIGRVQIHQLADGLFQIGHPGVGLRREELEREERLSLGEQVADFHGANTLSYLQPCRTSQSRCRSPRVSLAWSLLAWGAGALGAGEPAVSARGGQHPGRAAGGRGAAGVRASADSGIDAPL